MKNLSSQKTVLLTIIIAIVVTAVLVGGLYLWLDYREDMEESTSSNQTSVLEGDVVVDTELIAGDWIILPFFSDYTNFVISFPSSWELSEVVGEYQIYEGQPLVSFRTNLDEFGFDTTSFEISYAHDTGDTLEEWVAKRTDVLIDERGVEPKTRSYQKQGTTFVEKCFPVNRGVTLFSSCHSFYQQSPYIIEMKTEALNTVSFATVQNVHDTYLDTFIVLDDGAEWELFEASNAGFTMRYPEEQYPPVDSNELMSVGFAGDNDAYMRVQAVTGYQGGALDYWYDMTQGIVRDISVVPQEVFVGGTHCYFADLRSNNAYFAAVNNVTTYCQVGNRIFEIDMHLGDTDDINTIFLEMLGTMEFETEAELSKDQYSFTSNALGFSFDYSSSLNVYQTAATGEADYIAFEERTFDGLNWKKFGITYEKTTLSLEGCLSNDACFIWGTLSDYTSRTFAGEVMFYKMFTNDYGDNINVNDGYYIQKRGEYIIQIEVVTNSEGDNELIDAIVDSFTFF